MKNKKNPPHRGMLKQIPRFEDISFKAVQLYKTHLSEDVNVNLKTIIEKTARISIGILMPVHVSHMSFGALRRSKNVQGDEI